MPVLARRHGRCPQAPALITSHNRERRPERQGMVRAAVLWLVLLGLAVPMSSLPAPPARYVRRFKGPTLQCYAGVPKGAASIV